MTKDDDLVAVLEKKPRIAPLNSRQSALLNYALKLTESPYLITEDDINALRQAGLSDLAIHDAAAITSYFNFVNRLASGLGVDLEEEKSRKHC